MATARVSASHAEAQSGNVGTTRTLAYGGGLTSGSLLVVAVSTYAAGAHTVAVSDDANGAYTHADVYNSNANNSIVSLWYVVNTSTGTPTVSVAPSTAMYMGIALDEWTGLSASPLRSGATAVAFTITTDPVSPTVTAAAGDLVIVAAANGSVGAFASVDSPFTLITNVDGSVYEGLATAYDANATGNEAATFRGATKTGAITGASFAPATGASAPAHLGLLGVG